MLITQGGSCTLPHCFPVPPEPQNHSIHWLTKCAYSAVGYTPREPLPPPPSHRQIDKSKSKSISLMQASLLMVLRTTRTHRKREIAAPPAPSTTSTSQLVLKAISKMMSMIEKFCPFVLCLHLRLQLQI